MATSGRRRLADTTVRVVGRMHTILADARNVGAPIPEQVAVSVEVWRVWAQRLDRWAGQAEGDRPGDMRTTAV
jgi:hypothetical protein